MESHYRRLTRLAFITGLLAAIMSLAPGGANADPTSLRTQAQAELASVTVDVDRANIMFSPADDGTGSNFVKVEDYQQEYLAGQKSFDQGKYAEALQHLRKADKIIRSQPDWTESE
jgi:hypothetical protein